MDNRRMTSGRMAKVETRRRRRKIIIGVTIVVGIVVAGIAALAILHKNGVIGVPRREEPAEETVPDEVVEEPDEIPDFLLTADKPRLLLVNSTAVPQRFGNAVATLEEYNAETDGVFDIETSRPRIRYGSETVIMYQRGYEAYAAEIGQVIGQDFPRTQVDITFICGGDYSELVLTALVKQGELDEDVRVEVLNGCGIEGAAGKTREALENNEYTVVSIGNADDFDYKKSIILAPDVNRDISVPLSELFGMPERDIKEPDYNIKVIIGDDY
ncbi:MAG: LytR C-terminal domain-containing protein [bacterium]|nr:LytR C-terminal domain-containing protein [bacterium]